MGRRFIVEPEHPVDVLFVTDSPNLYSVCEKRFVTNDDPEATALEYMFNSTLMEYKEHLRAIYNQVDFNPLHSYAYTVSCLIDSETPASMKVKDKNKPNTRSIQRCHELLFNTIRRLNPKIIIPVGPAAAKALYIPFKKHDKIIAKTTKVRVHDKEYPAVPIKNGENIVKYDDAYAISKWAIWSIFEKLFHDTLHTKQNIDISKYVFPKTVEEVRDLCRNVIIPACSGENKDFLAVDIETNTKYAYYKDAKMIMISFSWGDGESCAIWCDSKHANYEYDEIRPYIQEVLGCNARKVFHNGSFDYKFIAYKYLHFVNNICWDTMLAEHILDENLKGFYNLEFLAGKYYPRYENYKQLALKKISKKDDMSNENEDVTAQTVLENVVMNNDAYSTAAKAYDDAQREYREKSAKYKRDKVIYDQDMVDWTAKYSKWTKIKLNGLSKEEADEVRRMREEGKECKPVKPTRKDITKPDKSFIDKYLASASEEDFENYDPRDLEVYCAMDGDITRKIAVKQKGKIAAEDPNMFTIIGKQHVPGIKMLSSMEFIGANTDQAYLDKIEAELKIEHEQLERDLKHLSGMPEFKPNSPAQVGVVLHSKYQLPINKEMLTATLQPKTDKAALVSYIKKAAMFPDKDANKMKDDDLMEAMKSYVREDAAKFAYTLLRFRDVGKAFKTTVGNFRKYTAYDGRLRSNFHQNGTTTGRLSSSSLNLQNIALMGGGKNLKKFIIPDAPDHILVNVDIKSAEIRCLLAYAQEQVLIDAILNGFDMHCFTASDVYFDKHGAGYDTKEKFYEALLEAHESEDPNEEQQRLNKLRKNTKAVNFGLIYGITKFGLSRDLGCSEDEAQGVIDDYFRRYPRIKKYLDDTNWELYRNQEVQSLTRRKRRFPRYALNKGRAFRQGINFKIQNISSDLVVRVLGNMHRNIGKLLGGRLVLTVHDSVLISMPRANLNKLGQYLDQEIVERVAKEYQWLPVPFEYDIEVGENYGEMHRFSERDYTPEAA